MVNLTERFKNFFTEPKSIELSSEVDQQKVTNDFNDTQNFEPLGCFFDDGSENYGYMNHFNQASALSKQKAKIQSYRKISMTPDVSVGIDEIVNEVTFNSTREAPLKVFVESEKENKKITEAIQQKFGKVIRLVDLKRNFYNIVRNSYIDGQIVLHCSYDDKNTKNGIQTIKMIDPCDLQFNRKTQKYEYSQSLLSSFGSSDKEKTKKTYHPEEIVFEDFGIRSEGLNLSYLEYAIKHANMLKVLEDLLVPLRFSRSISRRVFNVDVGDMPSHQAARNLNDIQKKFKYKVFYDTETGEVKNRQHITSMVEDYWFSNRSGNKGTEVDVLDESGNLGEVDDILYIVRKLYKSMKIPPSRITQYGDDNSEFEHDTNRITRDELNFILFVNRLRMVYTSLFKKLLKRELISTGVLTNSDWEVMNDNISVAFAAENVFFERMNLQNLSDKLEIYETVQAYSGKLFSVETTLDKVFNMSREEMEEEYKKIQEEKKNDLFKSFYEQDDI